MWNLCCCFFAFLALHGPSSWPEEGTAEQGPLIVKVFHPQAWRDKGGHTNPGWRCSRQIASVIWSWELALRHQLWSVCCSVTGWHLTLTLHHPGSLVKLRTLSRIIVSISQLMQAQASSNFSGILLSASIATCVVFPLGKGGVGGLHPCISYMGTFCLIGHHFQGPVLYSIYNFTTGSNFTYYWSAASSWTWKSIQWGHWLSKPHSNSLKWKHPSPLHRTKFFYTFVNILSADRGTRFGSSFAKPTNKRLEAQDFLKIDIQVWCHTAARSHINTYFCAYYA